MTFGHSPSLIRKVLGIDPKNVIHRACVYNVGLHNDNVPKHLPLHTEVNLEVVKVSSRFLVQDMGLFVLQCKHPQGDSSNPGNLIESPWAFNYIFWHKTGYPSHP